MIDVATNHNPKLSNIIIITETDNTSSASPTSLNRMNRIISGTPNYPSSSPSIHLYDIITYST